jgi:hypothetical protein
VSPRGPFSGFASSINGEGVFFLNSPFNPFFTGSQQNTRHRDAAHASIDDILVNQNALQPFPKTPKAKYPLLLFSSNFCADFRLMVAYD